MSLHTFGCTGTATITGSKETFFAKSTMVKIYLEWTMTTAKYIYYFLKQFVKHTCKLISIINIQCAFSDASYQV